MVLIKRLLSFFIAFALVSFFAYNVSHASEWLQYESKSKLFEAYVPGNVDEKVGKLRISKDVVLLSSDLSGFVDQRPYRNSVNNYVIKLNQTFGPAISFESKKQIMQRDLDLYERLYEDMGVVVLDRAMTGGKDELKGHIMLQYSDAELGEQYLKSLITLSNTTRIEQLYTGSERDLEALNTRQFFDSFDFTDGLVIEGGDLNDAWLSYESPFSLFTIKIPGVANSYVPKAPSIESSGDREHLGVVFTDPVWAQSIFYNVRGYRMNEEMSFKTVEEILVKDYLEKHGRGRVSGIELRKSFVGDIPFIQARYPIRRPKAHPYVNYAQIRALFLGNYVVVQEVLGAKPLVQTAFVKNFFDFIEFTPKKAHETFKKSQ